MVRLRLRWRVHPTIFCEKRPSEKIILRAFHVKHSFDIVATRGLYSIVFIEKFSISFRTSFYFQAMFPVSLYIECGYSLAEKFSGTWEKGKENRIETARPIRLLFENNGR